MMTTAVFLSLCLLAAIGPGSVWAGDVPHLTAGRAAGEVRIDGALDDEAWNRAVNMPIFVDYLDGTPMAVQSRGRLCWNDDALLFAVECLEPEMDRRVVRRRGRDASLWEEDSVEIFIQPAGRTAYYHFIVNSLGILYDAEGSTAAYNSAARVAAAGQTDRWTLEMSIPWSDLKGPPGEGDTWRINVCRARRLTGFEKPELSCWSTTGPSFHSVTRFGKVRFAATAVQTPFEQGDPESAERLEFLKAEERVLSALPAAATREVAAGRQALAVLAITPLTGDMILPRKPLPDHAQYTDRIRITACRGEYEPAGFVVFPFRALRLAVECSDVAHENTDGVIAASNLSIKGVKCWYQAGTAWHSEAQDKSTRVLIPELLLGDDRLVRVDHEKQENFLRLDFEDGAEYHSISYADETRGWPDDVFPGGRELPVRDSPTLLPLDLPEREHKQFMITAHVPEDATPGLYTGELTFRSEGEVLETIRLELRVLPFELAEPMRYDLQDRYHSSIYALQVLEGGHDQHSRTREQMAAEYRNMITHGVDNPLMFQLSETYDLALFAEALKLRKKVGIRARPVFLGILAPRDANLGAMRKSDPESLAQIKAKAKEIMDVVEGVLGHRDVYFYGWDEGHGEELDEQRPIWEAIHETGGKVIASGYRPGMKDDPRGAIGRVGDLLDCFVTAAGTSRGEADDWHRHGQMVWSYANPQAGRENPRVYRRNYGLEVWTANFDGAADFAYYAALNNPWNDLDYYIRDFLFVYPAIDGVIDTLAWEGYREGIDDIRYGTTLRLAIARARESGDPARHAAADAAEQFLETLDLSGDLDAIRAGMIRHILALRKE